VSFRYLLDINTLSEPIKDKADAQVVARIHQHAFEVVTAAQVLFEILQGAHRMPDSRRKSRIFEYLNDFVLPNVPVLAYDETAATRHGEESARLILQGKTAPFIDGQIAAIARTNHLILVTRNTADFRHFDALKVENWFNA